MDRNSNSIVSLDEMANYFARVCAHLLGSRSQKIAVVRALKIATGKDATVEADGKFGGQAWTNHQEFCQVMSLALCFQKIFVLLVLTEEEQAGPPLNINFDKFRAIAKILKVKLSSKSAGTEYLNVKSMASQSGQQSGRDDGAVTLDDMCLWYVHPYANHNRNRNRNPNHNPNPNHSPNPCA